MTKEQTLIAAEIGAITKMLNDLLADAEAEGLKFFICYQSDNNDFITLEGKRKMQVDIKKNLLAPANARQVVCQSKSTPPTALHLKPKGNVDMEQFQREIVRAFLLTNINNINS